MFCAHINAQVEVCVRVKECVRECVREGFSRAFAAQVEVDLGASFIHGDPLPPLPP